MFIKVPNYNEKLRSSVTVQEFFFASFGIFPFGIQMKQCNVSRKHIH